MPKQSSDNILGAPAEGFGQNITFAFKPDDRPPTLDAAGAAGGRSGVQGSPTSTGLPGMREVHPLQQDPTVAIISKIANSIIEPRMKQARAEAFVTGMQRAATGEAVKDIAADQPFYSSIFGDSDVVEGARAYTSHAKAAEAVGAVEDSMPEVRKLDPQAAHQYYSKLVTNHLTGDAATDASIMQAFVGTLPATMRRQSKEHYAYRQEEASIAESDAVMKNATLLQKRAGADVQTTDEYVTNAIQFFSSMRPAEGRDPVSWQKARTKDLLNLAQAGQFHAINAIKGSGLLEQLHPDERTKIESAVDSAENRTITRAAVEYAPELGRIAGSAEVFTTDGIARTTKDIQALNADFRKKTGIDRDLVSFDKAGGIIKDAWASMLREGQHQLRERETAAKKAELEGDKARASALLTQGAIAAVAYGAAGDMADATKASVVNKAFEDQWKTWDRPTQAQMAFMNFTGSQYVNPGVKQRFEGRAQAALGAADPLSFLPLYDDWNALREKSPGLADAYMGQYKHRMEYFDGLLDKSKPPGERGESAAFKVAFGGPEPHGKKLSKDEEKAAVGEFNSAHQYGYGQDSWWKMFGVGSQRMALKGDQAQQAMDYLRPRVERFHGMPGSNVPEALHRGLSQAQQEEGADIVGGYLFRGDFGHKPLMSYLRTRKPAGVAEGRGDSTDANAYWDPIVSDKLEAMAAEVGTNTDNVVIHRAPDVRGEAAYSVVFRKNGMPIERRLTSGAIENFALDRKGRKVAGVVQ